LSFPGGIVLRHSIRKLSAALAGTAALSLSAGAMAFTPPPFPHLAGVQNGGGANYGNASYQSQLARMNVLLLGYWPRATWDGQSMESIVRTLKAKNPDLLVFLYTDMDALAPSGGNWQAPLRNEVSAMKWWLYSGANYSRPVPSFYSGDDTVNTSPYTRKDSSGDDSVAFFARWYASNFYAPNPAIDGLFMDNVFAKPRVAGDWYNNNVVLQPSSSGAQAAIQAGYAAYFARLRQLMPGKYQIGNIGSWMISVPSVPARYKDMLNGGLLEGLIGQSWSTESWGGWALMMKEYDTAMQVTSAPNLVILHQWGSPTDYQSFRYGFASVLMNNGYYAFSGNSTGMDGLVWFDEYNAKLGNAIGAPPTRSWQKGVWRRDFTNGIALVNPKGNGPQTVSLGGTFVRIRGTQDPAVNNGQTVTSVTLQNRDGLILLRKTPLAQPATPTSVTVGTG
jgi:Hypothetical glycosyl hydrolase family 15